MGFFSIMKQFVLQFSVCKRRRELSFNLSFCSNTASFSNCLGSEHDEIQLSKGKQKRSRKGGVCTFPILWQNGVELSIKHQQCHNVILYN